MLMTGLFATAIDKWCQCDQIGRFLKNLGDKISYKSSPNDWKLFVQLKKNLLFCKNYCCYFLGNFWKHLGYFLLQHLVTLNGFSIPMGDGGGVGRPLDSLITAFSEVLHMPTQKSHFDELL